MENRSEIPFEARRTATIEKAVEIYSADPRFAAGWLEGSLADGSADPFSDIDLYLCVEDGVFDQVWNDRLAIVEQAAPIAASLRIGGMTALGCLLEGPVKLDIFFERRSAIGANPRIAVRRLWGDEAIFAQLKIAGAVLDDAAIRAALQLNVLGFLQGGTWPIRQLARGQLETFLFNEILLVVTAIVPLMLVARDRRAFARNMFTRAKLLAPEERAECAETVDRIARPVQRRDRDAMRDIHVEIFRRICALARAAFQRFGMNFPERAERELVSFYNREWPALG